MVDADDQIVQLGSRIRAARKRRNISATDFATKIGVALSTVRKLESGHHGVAIGTVVKALKLLDLAGDLDTLAANDTAGYKILEERLLK